MIKNELHSRIKMKQLPEESRCRFGVVVSGQNGVHIYPANPIQY